MPYAWDEPTLLNKIRVQARLADGASAEARVADYALDALGDGALLSLPTHGGTGGTGVSGRSGGLARRLERTLSTDMPDELKQRLVSLLAAEFAKKAS